MFLRPGQSFLRRCFKTRGKSRQHHSKKMKRWFPRAMFSNIARGTKWPCLRKDSAALFQCLMISLNPKYMIKFMVFPSFYLISGVPATLLLWHLSHVKTMHKFQHTRSPFWEFLKSLRCGFRSNSVTHSQYHGWWWPGSLRHQDSSTHDIDYEECVSSYLTWGRISTTCVLSNTWNCGCACAGNAGNVFPATAIPTCITARAWRTCRNACRGR